MNYIIRKSVAALFFKIFVYSLGLFLIQSIVYLALTNFLTFDEALPYSKILIASLGISIELILIFTLFLRWQFHYYTVDPTSITEHKGILLKKQQVHTLNNTQTIQVSQTIFGKLLDYGNVRIFNPFSNLEIALKNISDVEHVVANIRKALPIQQVQNPKS